MKLATFATLLIVIILQLSNGAHGWVAPPRHITADRHSTGGRLRPQLLVARNGEQHDTTKASCEVVGARGRLGSLWFKAIPNAVEVPRGVFPGSLSSRRAPIYVSIPFSDWRMIYDKTPLTRRQDLCWIGNGLLQEWQEHSTVVVPHFGVLSRGADPVNSALSPPTYVYGRNSGPVKDMLQQYGIRVEVIDSWAEIQTLSARKLLWPSIMWLLCHAPNKTGRFSPLTVLQVHEQRQEQVEMLVQELVPILEEMIGESCDLKETVDYITTYSLSIPTAIVSKELAMNEIHDRNGVWWAHRDAFPQPLHEEMLTALGASHVLLDDLEANTHANANGTQESPAFAH